MTKTAQKAHDIAFAVWRVATLMKNRKLREELENAAVEFTVRYEEVTNPALNHSATVVDILERLVALAESVKEMKPINAEVLKRELNKFREGLLLEKNERMRDRLDKVDLSKEFQTANGKNANLPFNSGEEGVNGNSETAEDISNRQTAILFKIRETTNCRMREIVEEMEDVSERTLRNDIQELIHKGLVQRVGGGGPNSYFESIEISLPPEHRVQETQKTA